MTHALQLRVHRRWTPPLVALALLFACGVTAAADARPVVIIGLVYDGPPPDEQALPLERFADSPRLIREEIRALTEREFDVRFPEDKRVVADWTLQGIHAAVDRLLADPQVDLVITLGVTSSSAVCRKQDLPKPVVAPFAIDAGAQELPLDGNASGVPNLNYLIRLGNVEQDLRKFRELVEFSRVHVLVDRLIRDSVPDLGRYAEQKSRSLGFELIAVPVEESAADTLGALDAANAEAVYITPLIRMPTGEFDALIAGLIERRVPSFSLQGQIEVERGILACLRRATVKRKHARRVASNVHRILLGEDAGSLPVVVDQSERLLINMSTAEAIGYRPRWRETLEADLIGVSGPWGHPRYEKTLTLSEAVVEAVEANLRLEAADRGISAGAQIVRLARTALRPAVDLSTSAVVVDADRAEASAGALAERTVSGGVAISQLVWSDRSRADIETTRHVQRSTEQERDRLRLDIALEAAVAFLDVLRATTLERVEFDNLRLTEENLELARRREQVGFSGPADVYRWESRLAISRSTVIRAHNDVHRVYLALNRILHRPLEDLFDTRNPPLDNPRLVTGLGRLNPYIDNRAGFDLFREFAVDEGLVRSRELAALDARIAAQEREHLAARRTFWSPRVGLFGELTRAFSRDGETPLDLGPLFSTGGSANRNAWSVGIEARLPLYSGGSRTARVRRESEELARLRIERRATAESVELRIRLALFNVASTFPAIELANEAADASRRNLELVTDAYSRGQVSVIELLDAQNSALVADEFASNAVYDFLIDLMELQRSTSDFDFFRSDAARDAWFERLAEFFRRSGFEIRRPGR